MAPAFLEILSDSIFFSLGMFATVNNLLQLSSPWIACPTVNENRPHIYAGPYKDVLLTSTYALTEILCYLGFFWFGAPPCALLAYWSLMHTWMGDLPLVEWVSNIRDQTGISIPDDQISKMEKSTSSSIDPATDLPTEQAATQPKVKFSKSVLFLPLVTAASRNAALSMFVADAFANQDFSKIENADTIKYIKYGSAAITVALYWYFWSTDRNLADVLRREGIFGLKVHNREYASKLLGYLLYLFLLKAGIAYLVDQWTGRNVLRLMIWPNGAQLVMDDNKLNYLTDLYERFPWLSPTISTVSIFMQIGVIIWLYRFIRQLRTT